MLNACRSLWRLKDWIAEGSDHDQGAFLSHAASNSSLTSRFAVELYSTFAQSVLAHLAASPATADDFVARLAMLDLLAFRVIRLRAISDSVKVSTLPFETFLACHLTFRQSPQATGESRARVVARVELIRCRCRFGCAGGEPSTSDIVGDASRVHCCA